MVSLGVCVCLLLFRFSCALFSRFLSHFDAELASLLFFFRDADQIERKRKWTSVDENGLEGKNWRVHLPLFTSLLFFLYATRTHTSSSSNTLPITCPKTIRGEIADRESPKYLPSHLAHSIFSLDHFSPFRSVVVVVVVLSTKRPQQHYTFCLSYWIAAGSGCSLFLLSRCRCRCRHLSTIEVALCVLPCAYYSCADQLFRSSSSRCALP